MTLNNTAHAYDREGGASFKGVFHFLFLFVELKHDIKITMDIFVYSYDLFIVLHFYYRDY